MHLGLGTVQFGLPYGVTNGSGVPSADAVAEIFALARDGGIDLIDTAAGYGEAERIIGDRLPADWRPRIVSKTLPVQGPVVSVAVAERLYQAAVHSVERIGRRPLHGLLLHHGRDVLKPGGGRLVDMLHRLKDDGITERIGASVYNDEEIDGVLTAFLPDIVQLPYNLCDRRLDDSGHLERLARLNVEVHARSIFLQGVLLAPPERLHPYFAPLVPVLDRLLAEHGSDTVGRAAACLSAVMRNPDIDAAIVGVAGPEELRMILDAAGKAPDVVIDPERYRIGHPHVLDPSTWPPRETLTPSHATSR